MRKELRQKVERREEQLKEALKISEAKGHPVERVRGLSTELSVVASLVSGGWEHMSDATAGRLSAWLEETTPLVGQPALGIHKPVPAPPVDAIATEVKLSESPHE